MFFWRLGTMDICIKLKRGEIVRFLCVLVCQSVLSNIGCCYCSVIRHLIQSLSNSGATAL